MNLNQVTVPVTDVEASIAFYSKLGLRLIVKSLPEYARFECSAGDATFSLHRVDRVPESGIWIYFEVEDVEKTIQELSDKGVEIEEQPESKRWLWRESRLNDLDGNQIIIYHAGSNRKNPPWRLGNTAT